MDEPRSLFDVLCELVAEERSSCAHVDPEGALTAAARRVGVAVGEVRELAPAVLDYVEPARAVAWQPMAPVARLPARCTVVHN